MAADSLDSRRAYARHRGPHDGVSTAARGEANSTPSQATGASSLPSLNLNRVRYARGGGTSAGGCNTGCGCAAGCVVTDRVPCRFQGRPEVPCVHLFVVRIRRWQRWRRRVPASSSRRGGQATGRQQRSVGSVKPQQRRRSAGGPRVSNAQATHSSITGTPQPRSSLAARDALFTRERMPPRFCTTMNRHAAVRSQSETRCVHDSQSGYNGAGQHTRSHREHTAGRRRRQRRCDSFASVLMLACSLSRHFQVDDGSPAEVWPSLVVDTKGVERLKRRVDRTSSGVGGGSKSCLITKRKEKDQCRAAPSAVATTSL